ncbi:MAG: hypothetical protein KF830_13875, partial [Planctomycetes bacterium]|nr:hypothetical protein [Planctomycetota bacterium]
PAPAPAPAPPAGDAAILLPGRALRELSPAARGTLLAVVGRLVPERPVPPARLLAVDVDAAPDAIASLLRWLP